MAKKKKILFPVIFMVVLTGFFTFILAFLNDVTSETIAEQQELVIQRSLFYAFNINTEDMDDETIKSEFKEHITKSVTDDMTYYTYKDGDQTIGYAVEISGKGLWGTITGHIAFTPDHERLIGVNFISHSETPGLGGRIDEDEFKSQFRDASLTKEGDLFAYNKSTGGNVDAISGATLTSISVRDIFNTEIPKILETAKEEGFYEGH